MAWSDGQDLTSLHAVTVSDDLFTRGTFLLAKIVGVGIVGVTTYFVSYLTVAIIVNAPVATFWILIAAFAFLGLASWALTSFGEWLWSLEGGWYGLQRFFRLVQAAVVGGGFACTMFFKILHTYFWDWVPHWNKIL